MSSLPTTFFGWVGFLLEQYGPLFAQGVLNTLLIAVSGTVLGFVLGLLVAILRTIPPLPCRSLVPPRASKGAERAFGDLH